MNLRDIYLETLARCTPDRLVAAKVDPSWPRNVVAIGKCAAGLLDGVARTMTVENAFVAVPTGYPLPSTRAEVHAGGHPQMTRASFDAGRALLAFVDAHPDLLFLLSGGGSACVEVARDGVSEDDVIAENARLVASSLSIAGINARRRELSAIKGGKLRDRVRGRCITLVYSDVSTGALADVASGPTLHSAEEGILVADNRALTATAAGLAGAGVVTIDQQLECDVVEGARILAERAGSLRPGGILVAGGEMTVARRGDGQGGRCSELAVRFALQTEGRGFTALFGSSDGVDGSSGAAGVWVGPRRDRCDRDRLEAALNRSDSRSVIAQVGEPIMIAPTGNNLRDLFLVARD